MGQLTEKQKYEIIIRSELNQSSRFIADEMGINRKSVLKWIRKYKKDQNINRKKGSGRKRKTNKEDDKKIFTEIINENPIITTDEIKDKLKERNINLGTTTIKKKTKRK